MSAHRAVIEAGPGTIRRLCCRTGDVADDKMSGIIRSALEAIDDPVALVGERPVAVASLWADALRWAACPRCSGVVIVHPSWWSSSRAGVVRAAGDTVFGDVVLRPRSRLLMRATDAEPDSTVLVEIAERLVWIAGADVVALPRRPAPHPVADEAAAAIAGMAAAVVLIDTPSEVAGVSTLASSIADAARRGGRAVVHVDGVRLARLAQSAASAHQQPPPPARSAVHGDRARSRPRVMTGLAAAAVVLAAAAPAVVTEGRRDAVIPAAPVQTAPTTFLVEGRVAVTVPAGWPIQRVIAGPGSARVQVTSPADPDVAVHVTQSPVVGETLSGTAERLKRAIDAEAVGVFVDFNPLGTIVGRPAVTYREVRAGHDVRWTVFLDGPVRISIGCQSRPGGEDAVRSVCEQAVRSAHAIT